MDSSFRDRCAECGKTRSNVVSITQWISLGDKCSCGSKGKGESATSTALQPQQPEKCNRCGGSISKQSGSLTQWVIRSAPCTCGDNGGSDSSSALAPAESDRGATETDDDGYVQIEVDSARFPLERYSPISLIGSGQQADVYKAKDRLLGRIVCIKILRTSRLLPEQAVLFQREAKTGAKLSHPNLTTALDFGLTEQGQPFLVMEFCSGVPLSDLIEEHGAVPIEIALNLLCQVCDGMQYAHEQGVLHRDLKPSNILISDIDSEFPRVKIIDFGIAGLLDTIDDTGKFTHDWLLVGTPAYMSPEQARQQKLDERSDLYSFGCLMFETLTGEPVFENETSMAVLDMHAHETPPSLAERADHIEFSNEVEQLVANLLEKDPSLRVQSMDELKKSLLIISGFEIDNTGATIHVDAQIDDASSSSDAIGASAYSVSQFDKSAVQTATTKKNSNFIFLAAVSIICALIIAGAVITGGGMVSELSRGGSPLPEFKTYELADASWLIVTGNVHGDNAKLLELDDSKFEPHMKIVDPEFSDNDLLHLEKLPLRVLDLSGTNITDNGLVALTRIKSLQSLIINNNKNITDAGMKTLNQIPDLRIVSVRATSVTDEGTPILAENTRLTSIDISDLKNVTGRSLESLRNLPNLLCLRIGNTSIKSSDLDVLKEYKNLRGLDLAELGLTNADMEKLGAFKNLLFLNVSGNRRVTRDGLAKLNLGKY